MVCKATRGTRTRGNGLCIYGCRCSALYVYPLLFLVFISIPHRNPYSYSYRIGGCDEVLQWGFDETTLDGQACFNQWCLIRTGTSYSIVTIECSGVVPCSTAVETVLHIQKTWERGQVKPKPKPTSKPEPRP